MLSNDIHEELLRKGYTYFDEEDVYSKCYKQPVIGFYGNHGLMVTVFTKDNISIQIYAPSGRIVDDVINLSGVQQFEVPADVTILDEWVKSLVDKVV